MKGKILQIGPLALLAVLAIASFKYLLMPTWQKARQIPGEVKAQEEKLRVIEEKLKFLDGISEEEIKNQLAALTRALPGEKDPIAPILAIRSGTGRSGTILLSLETSPGSVQGEATPSTEQENAILYSISVAGSETQLKSFLDEIGKTTPLLWVNSLQYAGGESGSGNIDLSSFFLSDTVDIGSSDAPLIPLDERELGVLDQVGNLAQPIIIPTEFTGTFTGEVGKTNPFQ